MPQPVAKGDVQECEQEVPALSVRRAAWQEGEGDGGDKGEREGGEEGEREGGERKGEGGMREGKGRKGEGGEREGKGGKGRERGEGEGGAWPSGHCTHEEGRQAAEVARD